MPMVWILSHTPLKAASHGRGLVRQSTADHPTTGHGGEAAASLLRPSGCSSSSPRDRASLCIVFGRIGWRPAPHIFTQQEIGDLLAAARRLEPTRRFATYEVLLGVLEYRACRPVRHRSSAVPRRAAASQTTEPSLEIKGRDNFHLTAKDDGHLAGSGGRHRRVRRAPRQAGASAPSSRSARASGLRHWRGFHVAIRGS